MPVERLREQAVAPRREGGVKDGTVRPATDTVRRAIDAQMCPFCERGPFKMLPVHTNKVHGVDKWELRDLAGLTTNDPLCSPEARDAMRAKASAEAVTRATAAARDSRRPQRWTQAGRAKNRATLVRWEAEHPEEAHAVRRAAGERAAEVRWG